MKLIFSILFVMLCCVGCGPDDDKNEVTKDQARALDGTDDSGGDLCAQNGWYNDGECDSFCPDVDKDCLIGCTDDSDCRSGEACVAGLCEPVQNNQGCGGIAGLTCGAGEVCIYAPEDICGAADQLGSCVVPPDACAAIYEPVCGCDGQTYGNACSATIAGASVASEGECSEACVDNSECAAGEQCVSGVCEAAATACGGIAGIQCPSGSFCIYAPEDFCGAADHLGTCVVPPDACDQQYDPVCGCDGQTYGNACSASAAGASIASSGECAQTCASDTDCGDGQTCTDGICADVKDCGGFAGLTCDANEFCHYELEDFCGAADALGTCAIAPDACDQQYDPVCGCDNQTYGNACSASQAGVSVAAEGECQQ